MRDEGEDKFGGGENNGREVKKKREGDRKGKRR